MLVIGDSMMVIKQVFELKYRGGNSNSTILKRIAMQLKKFEELAFSSHL